MQSEMWLFTLVLLGIFTIAMKYFKLKTLKLPGPDGLPFLGNVHQLKKGQAHLTLSEWSKKYGAVFKIKMFGQDFVVLNSYESIYEALAKKRDEFAGRPSSFRTKFLLNYRDDVTFTSYSKKWVKMKKLLMQTLKIYGDKATLEKLSLQQIDELLNDIKEASKTKNTLNICPFIHRCVIGVILSVVFGKKETRVKTQILEELSKDTVKIIQPAGIYFMMDILPCVRFLPVFNEIYTVNDKMNKWFSLRISERKKAMVNRDPQCCVDAFFEEQRHSSETCSEFVLCDDEIDNIAKDMVFAGTGTTSITINALISVLINMPDIQDKMADEIFKILKEKTPSLADRANLPYVEATILEILRYSSIAPLSIPHYTMVDTSVSGFDIPKDTTVLFNLWNLHHNEDYWEKPWEFNPDRFLDKNGDLIPPDHIKRKRLLPFGANRRACAGEQLARNRLFLMVTSLIQNFRFEGEAPDRLPPYDPRDFEVTLDMVIPPYLVKVTPRK